MIVQLPRGFTMECNPETHYRFIMTIGRALCVDTKGYAVYWIKRKIYLYHRWVVNCTDPKLEVSHIDANPRNNWESNLTIGTRSQNTCNLNDKLKNTNTTGYRGVYWDKQKRKWRCLVMVNYKSEHLGYFDILEEAIEARTKAEIKYGFVPQVASVLG